MPLAYAGKNREDEKKNEKITFRNRSLELGYVWRSIGQRILVRESDQTISSSLRTTGRQPF